MTVVVVLYLGGTGGVLLFVVVPAVALAAAIALSLYEVRRIGERKLLIVLVILALMFQHQVLEAYAFWQSGELATEGLSEFFETGANLIASGSVYYVLRFARRERQLLADLERSERQYRTLIEESPVPVLLHGPRELRYVNDAAVEMFDAEDRSAVTGHPLADYLPADDSRRVTGHVLADGGTGTVECRLRTLGEETRHVSIAGAPAQYEGEDATQIIAQDLTQRKRRERELRAERDRRSVLFENNPDPILEVELVDGRPTIADVNGAFEDVFGFDADGLGGQTIAEAIVPDARRAKFERLVARTIRGETVSTEVRRRTDQGDREFLLRIIPFQTDDENDRAYVWYTDVTERNRRERAIRGLQDAIERMQQAESREGVADVAIDAARAVLDSPVAACWLQDPRDRRLDPVAATDAIGELDRLSSLSEGSAAYEAFSAGDVTTVGSGAGPECLPCERAVVLPLDGHGVVVAGRSDGAEYDEGALDVARTLAKHTTTALNRVERARAVRDSERRFRMIAERVDQVIYLSTADFSELLYINSAYEDVWGRSLDELGSDPRRFIEAVDPRDRDAFEADWEAMLADIERGDPDESYEFEYRIRRPDGEVRWIHSVGYPLEIADGEGRFVSIAEDVTERRELEQSYRTVFENVSDGLVVHEPDSGEILEINDRFCEMNGYDREELVGETVDVVTGPDYGYESIRDRITSVTPEESQLFEWQNRRKGGETFPVEVHLSVVDIRGNERVLASVRDITERKRREREYEQIFDGVTEGIAIQDPETAELLDANRAFVDRLGYDTVAQLREQGIDGLSVTEAGFTKENARELCQRVSETGESETVEWQHETRAGERRWVEATVTSAVIRGEERIVSMQRDVTERRQREREYEQIFDSVNDAITVFHPDTGEIIDVNEPYYEMLGYDDIETIRELGIEGLSVSDEGYTGEKGRELIREVAETGEPTTVEWRGQREDGERLWLEATLSPAEIGGERRVLSIQRDVTERKRREREYEQIFDGVNDMIAVHDPDTGALLDTNRKMCDLTGYDEETIRDLGAQGLLVDDPAADVTPEQVPAIIDRVMAGEEIEPYEQVIETADGDRIWLEVNPTRALIGGEARFLAISRDITERKRREREFEQIFNAVHEPISIQDPETAELLEVNDSLCEVLGYDRETIVEMGIEGFSPVDEGFTMERAREFIQGVMDSDEPRQTEWIIETADGERRWLDVRGTTADIGGEPRFIALNRDVTERRRREREYEQIFNGVNDAIGVFDPESYELIEVNDRMCELTGYDRETILREDMLLSATDEGYDRDRLVDLIDGVIESGEPRELEWRIVTADGDRRWMEVQATPATVSGEERLLTLSRDVTEHRRSERRLRAILDSIDEAIFFARPDELDGGTPSPDFVSSGYETIWGQPLEAIHETYDDGFFGTLHVDDVADLREFVRDVQHDIDAGEARERYSLDYRIERPDGEVRWVHSDYYPIRWGDDLNRVVVVSRDITERKRRERRMASFDQATDDLTTADSREEAARTAVEAASESLGLSAVGAFLYDDDAGVLRPEVVTSPLASDEADAIGPGDGPLWEGFASGSVVASGPGTDQRGAAEALGSAGAGLASLEAWRAIALGNHGLLVVGSTTGTLDSETIQTAHVLAATLEAALNHLQGQQRLAAQEERLRTQTRRADRLDRIARLTQQVESAITEATDPGEVERAVCERLAGSGPYDLAWIGGVDVGADRLSARAIVGAPGQYVETLELATTDDGADTHPAVRAWQRDEIAVAESIVDGGPAGDWRRHALSEGYQSLCAVPLTYDGITHGILTVGADSPNALGDRERDVLEQLGTSIGNALAAIERRRTLESDDTVELEFTGDDVDLPFVRAAREADCRVRHERTVAREDGTVTIYYSFEGDVSGAFSQIAAEAFPGTVDVVTQDAPSQLVTVETDDWFGSPLAEYGAVLRDATATAAETTVTVEVAGQADVRSFVERLQKIAPSLELVAKRHHQRQDRTPAELGSEIEAALTDRQLEVVRTALSAGYFEWPRENDGSEVADRLGITQPTLNKHLRLAERKTFTHLFDPDG